MSRLSHPSTLRRVRQRPVYGAVVVFVVALAVRVGYLSRILQGSLRTPPDTSSYLRACDVLFTDPLAISEQVKGLTYLGFTLPFCSVRYVSGGSGVAWAVVQVFLSTVTAVLVYYAGVRVVNVVAGFVAGISFGLLFETLRFVVFMLSETVFILALVLSLYAIIRYKDRPSKANLLLLLASFAWLITSRPFGFPIVAGWLAFDLFPSDSDYRIGFLPRRVAITGVVGVPVVVQLFTDVARKLRQVEDSWKDGWIYWHGRWDSPLASYDYTPRAADGLLEFFVVNLDHVLAMMFLRLFVFFIPLVPRLERGAIIYTAGNAVILIPLLIGSLLGIIRALRERPIVFSLFATPILVVVGITMVTFVSSSWRYRAPLAPFFALLTGYFVATSPRVSRLTKTLSNPVGFW